MKREELIQEIVENLARCQKIPSAAGWQKIGLPRAQVSMLFMLLHHPGASVKQIAEFVGITKSAVTQLMDPLVQKKLVTRQNDAKDRRIVRLSITSEGKKVIKEVNKLKFAGMRTALGALSGQDLKQLAAIYRKMAATKN
jgi:DNA-binding MarR family transcriptional regulator